MLNEEFRIRGVKTNIPFLQNTMKNKELHASKCAAPCLVVLAVVLGAIGIAMQILSDEIVEYEIQYAGKPMPGVNYQYCAPRANCTLKFHISKDMNGRNRPISVMYRLTKFYQNYQTI